MGNSDSNVTSVFDRIYNSTNKKVLAFIVAKCGNMEDVNDILQETYMELYTTLLNKGENYIENDNAFIINIAKSKIYKHYTVLQRVKADLPLSFLTNDNGEITLDLQSEEAYLEDSICTNELVNEIEDIIAGKPQEIRKIFFLRFSLELSITDIANLMRVKESYIKNKLYRTIQEIREIYKARGEVI